MPRPRHVVPLLRLSWFDHAFAQLAALLVVGALGAAALGASSAAEPVGGTRLSAATAAHSRTTVHGDVARPVSSRPVPGRSATAAATHTQATKPVAKPAPAGGSSHAGRATAAGPWQPTGTGMWLYEWRRSNHGNAASIVRKARHAGLSTLYVRTGSSWDGFEGGVHLRHLLRSTRNTSISVVAWDFPRLRRPYHDAMRLARAARISGGPHGPRVAAVAPDIETPSEGTFNAAWRVHKYLVALQRHLPAGVSVMTAVPWPSRYRIGDYPYRTVASHSDVLIPMAYWYNNRPAWVAKRSVGYLRQYHRPVAPVGQGYDGRIDVPGLRHNNLSKQVPAFLLAAHRAGARAISVWSWQAAPRPVWKAIKRHRHLFGARR